MPPTHDFFLLQIIMPDQDRRQLMGAVRVLAGLLESWYRMEDKHCARAATLAMMISEVKNIIDEIICNSDIDVISIIV